MRKVVMNVKNYFRQISVEMLCKSSNMKSRSQKDPKPIYKFDLEKLQFP